MSHLLSSPRHRALVLILVPLFLLAVSAQSLMLVAVTAMAVVFVADLQTDPMNEARYDEGLMGLSCLSKNVANSSKRHALDALNCLVFETPNNYWDTNAADVKNCVDNAALNDGPNHPCNRIAYGNWRCSFMFPPNRLSGCLKHDVSYSSLQKLGGDGGYHHMHQFWNPRNKHLADMTFVSDLKGIDLGCSLAEIHTCARHRLQNIALGRQQSQQQDLADDSSRYRRSGSKSLLQGVCNSSNRGRYDRSR